MTDNNILEAPLWQEYRTTLYRFILSRVQDAEIAEDIVQDVLIKVYKQLGSLKAQEKILPWMYQITRNAIVDYYRKQKPTEALSVTVAAQAIEMAAEAVEMEEDVEKELAQCLLPMVNQLTPTYRQAIKMAEFDGLTQKEIAQHQNLSLSGAKSRVQRGRKMLKEMLMACCQIAFDHQGKIQNYQCDDC